MKNRILPILLLLCFVISMSCTAFAAPLDTDAEAKLTLTYQKKGKTFPGLRIGIYRVAEAHATGAFTLIDPYAGYPINIHGITEQAQWTHIATTLHAYIVADGRKPDYVAETDEAGIVQFAGLKTGLYYVQEAVAENADGTYIFNRFLVYLPTPNGDGTYTYAVDAKPKCTEFIPKNHYTVTKLWQDDGNKENRPKEVTVDIFKDGVLQETKILNADCNWSYTWSVSGEDQSQWTVAERNVAEGYKVTIQQSGSNFSIINTCETNPDAPPLTGDSFNPLPWVLVMCISGVLLIIVAIYSRRKK